MFRSSLQRQKCDQKFGFPSGFGFEFIYELYGREFILSVTWPLALPLPYTAAVVPGRFV